MAIVGNSIFFYPVHDGLGHVWRHRPPDRAAGRRFEGFFKDGLFVKCFDHAVVHDHGAIDQYAADRGAGFAKSHLPDRVVQRRQIGVDAPDMETAIAAQDLGRNEARDASTAGRG